MVEKGEQGVLICQPYKSEIGIDWRFKAREIAEESAKKIYAQFLDYLQMGEFAGTDMARKYLQMGYTRARRYANYKGRSMTKLRIMFYWNAEPVNRRKRRLQMYITQSMPI